MWNNVPERVREDSQPLASRRDSDSLHVTRVNLPRQYQLLWAQYGHEFVRIRNAAEKLSQCVQSLTISAMAGWSSGCVSAQDPRRVEQIASGDAHRDDGKVAGHEHRGHFKGW